MVLKLNTTYLLILTISFFACDGVGRSRLGKAYAEKQLDLALEDTTQHNVIQSKSTIINDSVSAVTIAETILFTIYGKDNILKQRPYECYSFENYWVIGGTLPKHSLGGTFLFIVDSRNGQVIRITHGK